MLAGKRVLVTGCEGMIGRELVIMLEELGAVVIHADLKHGSELREFNNCNAYCRDVDYVFHLAGIKGNPKMTSSRPADFLVPMLQFNTNMLEAARLQGVKRFLYTSSIAVENPETDKYPAFAKMAGEMQIEAYKIQYPEFGNNCVIVRPANVYGRFDDFENPDAMVITSLVHKALTEDQIEVWGNGMQIRDFINAKDVARGMIQAMEEMPEKPVNLCSGKGITIKEIAEIILKETGKPIKSILKRS